MTTKQQRVRLADTCDLIAGFAFKSKDFGNYFEKVIKITNIEPPFVNMKDLQGVDLSMYNKDKLQKYIAKKGDYVFAMTGATIGKLGRICDGEAYINQRVLMFQPKENIDKVFLFYVLSQKRFYQYVINHIDSESAQANISANSIGNYEFNIPPLKVQKKIAGVLSSLDDKIELNNKINQNLELQAQTLFNKYFPNIFSGEKCIGNYISPKRGKNLLSKDAVIGDVPVIAGGLQPATYHNVANTVAPVITISASGANAGFVNLWHIPIWSSDSSFIDSSMTPYVYFWYMMLKLRQKEIFDSQTGSAQPHIYPQHIERLPLSDLDMEKVKEYNKIISSLFEKIGYNTKENNILSKLRDALLPKLMSGEIDVENLPPSAIIPNE